MEYKKQFSLLGYIRTQHGAWVLGNLPSLRFEWNHIIHTSYCKARCNVFAMSITYRSLLNKKWALGLPKCSSWNLLNELLMVTLVFYLINLITTKKASCTFMSINKTSFTTTYHCDKQLFLVPKSLFCSKTNDKLHKESHSFQ